MPLMSHTSKRWLHSALVAVALLMATPGPAAAQWIEFMEWLDRLSGPGPFRQDPQWVPSVRIPVGCITRVTTTKGTLQEVQDALRNPQQAAAAGADVPRALETVTSIEVEPFPGCLGLRGLLGAYKRSANDINNSPPWGVKRTPDGGRPVVRKDSLVAFDFSFANLSGENELPYRRDLSDDQKRVSLFVLGIGARVNLHEYVVAAWSWNNYRFYSPGELFEPFNRKAQTFEAGLRLPFIPEDFRPVLIVGVSTGLGEFTARNFGATGDWRGFDKHTPFFKIGYEFWHNGCWRGLCRESTRQP